MSEGLDIHLVKGRGKIKTVALYLSISLFFALGTIYQYELNNDVSASKSSTEGSSEDASAWYNPASTRHRLPSPRASQLYAAGYIGNNFYLQDIASHNFTDEELDSAEQLGEVILFNRLKSTIYIYFCKCSSHFFQTLSNQRR